MTHIDFRPDALKGHLDRVNAAIIDPVKKMEHEDAMRSIELVKARALIAIVEQLDGIRARLGE